MGTILASLAISCVSAASAAADGADAAAAGATGRACALIPARAVANAVALPHASESSSARSGGSGSLSSGCLFTAWRGQAPRTQKQLTSKLLGATAATVTIQAQEEAPGPSAEQWRKHGYDQALLAAFKAIASEVVVVLGGARLEAPKLGAQDAGGYQATTGRRSEAVGIWWDRAKYRFITIEVVGSSTKPTAAQLSRIAATAVPTFGL